VQEKVEMWTVKMRPARKFEILVGGKPRSSGDVKDVAIASAELIQS
jgi:hypothetical protein